ncbi:MAG: hypothetical protein ACPLKQ_07065 [Candidatus Bathyarchaeales archaeon]
MVKKTTIILRDDVYQALREKAGAKNVSRMVNEIILEYFSKGESMFGTMKKVGTSDLRNHEDRLSGDG